MMGTRGYLPLTLRRFVDNPTWAEAKVQRDLRRADEFDSKPATEILRTLYRSFGRRGTAPSIARS